MRMKSYFAPTVEAAMDQARREMGPEALLVNSRKAPPEARGMGEYEVVFAVLAEGADDRVQSEPEPHTRARAEASPEDPVLRELIRLRRQVEEMGTALTGLNAHASLGAVPAAEFSEAFSRLIEHGFSVELATRIVKQAHARLDADPASWTRRKLPFDSQSIQRAVRTELEAVISVDSDLSALDDKPRVLALVGPPGCGKTTTLVKLAVRYGLAFSRPVRLLSADTHRVGALEQLRTYAAILGAGFDAVETPRGVQQTIEAHQQAGLILIDTPGYAAGEMDEASELARFLTRASGVETHLVASASMRPADLSRALDRFEIFTPAKLIFTHLDETSFFGAMISESARGEKPISFLAAGQQIPEDIEPATPDRLLNFILEETAERALSAA
jgi:flagellar biosynthesis protein FlhF